MTTRRHFLTIGGALALTGILTIPVSTAAQTSDTFPTESGEIVVHPISHASFWMETPAGVILVDPVGAEADYEDMPDPDLVLITHEHGDHYDPELLSEITAGKTQMITNIAVYDMLPSALQMMTQQVANGDSTDALGVEITAVPAYNITEGRLDFHPEGRDNGYVLAIDGMRVYVSGDTEGTSEMRALKDIDLAFVSMNLPFTMAVEQAADAVAEFAPAHVYPYHYRGRDGGTQDPEAFAELLQQAGAGTEVHIGNWYPEGL
ncbi:MBL fold metallo-hydrolase [Palleronia sp. LCG004]|uniref:MBL fold metallo-hydrolase n=1 Tax=Palleronia sp. LCG004 TaxID=3079304 RepID=UPI0029435D1D|nr:MBL fold metallo-hydrolase [Palleronia sp. LCG004]WOI56888.1 MBL fold metallo-hydrolase [Palleronia sp. LCG004]